MSGMAPTSANRIGGTTWWERICTGKVYVERNKRLGILIYMLLSANEFLVRSIRKLGIDISPKSLLHPAMQAHSYSHRHFRVVQRVLQLSSVIALSGSHLPPSPFNEISYTIPRSTINLLLPSTARVIKSSSTSSL